MGKQIQKASILLLTFGKISLMSEYYWLINIIMKAVEDSFDFLVSPLFFYQKSTFGPDENKWNKRGWAEPQSCFPVNSPNEKLFLGFKWSLALVIMTCVFSNPNSKILEPPRSKFVFIILKMTGFAARFQHSGRYIDPSLWGWDIQHNVHEIA